MRFFPLPGASYAKPLQDKGHHPIPDFPPYDVQQPHMHGAPTMDDTSQDDFDSRTVDKNTKGVFARDSAR